jgi:hypothetical protein
MGDYSRRKWRAQKLFHREVGKSHDFSICHQSMLFSCFSVKEVLDSSHLVPLSGPLVYCTHYSLFNRQAISLETSCRFTLWCSCYYTSHSIRNLTAIWIHSHFSRTPKVSNHAAFEFTMFTNSGFREAPPTKKPSTSAWVPTWPFNSWKPLESKVDALSSLQLAAVTLPP